MTGRMKLGIGVAILAGLAALALWRIEAASSAVLTARYPTPASPPAASATARSAINWVCPKAPSRIASQPCCRRLACATALRLPCADVSLG